MQDCTLKSICCESHWNFFEVLNSCLSLQPSNVHDIISWQTPSPDSRWSLQSLTSAAAWNPGRYRPRGPSAGRLQQWAPRGRCLVSEGGGRCTWSRAAGRCWMGPRCRGETRSWAAPRCLRGPEATHGGHTASRRTHWKEGGKDRNIYGEIFLIWISCSGDKADKVERGWEKEDNGGPKWEAGKSEENSSTNKWRETKLEEKNTTMSQPEEKRKYITHRGLCHKRKREKKENILHFNQTH